LRTPNGRRGEGGGGGTPAEPELLMAWLAAAESATARMDLRVQVRVWDAGAA
jgi:hypothetical protein